MVLLGADRISASAAVSNKTGSLPAVLCAKHVAPGAKVVGPRRDGEDRATRRPQQSCGRRHWPWPSRAGLEERVQQRPGPGAAATLSKLMGDGGNEPAQEVVVQVKNTAFEWIPPELIDTYVTEGWPVEGRADWAAIGKDQSGRREILR